MQTDSNLTIAGRYELTELRSERGGVEVYDALDTLLDRPVDVQILSKAMAQDADASRRFLRHQQIASSISNCPLLAVYDAGTWDGRPFSVMECDKGSPPQSLYRQGYPTDVALAVSLTRQVADALVCCREAGLADWSFSPEAVRVMGEDTACLVVAEGYSGPFSSSSPSVDAAALSAVLALMLTGEPDPGEAGLAAALVPSWFIARLARLDPRLGGSAITAGDFAGQLEAIEEVAESATQAYTPSPNDGSRQARAEAATASVASLAALAEAPTLAANLPVSDMEPKATDLQVQADNDTPYTPPANDALVEEAPSERRKRPAALLFVGALVAVALLTALLVPRLSGTNSVSADPKSSDSATPSGAIQVPDVQGKTLDDARHLIGGSGLNLAAGDAIYAATPRDLVAAQEPAPGTLLQAGQLVTVSLSLGPQPVQAQPPAKPPAQPASVQPPAPAPPKEKPHAKPHDKGKDHQDDDDADDGD